MRYFPVHAGVMLTLEETHDRLKVMGEVLKILDASVHRDGRNILDSLTWQVEEGQRWVIFGPNGAGKTTVVQLISGRLFPSSGSVSIVGQRLGKVSLAELYPLIGVLSSAVDSRIPRDQKAIDVVRTAAYGQIASWRESYDAHDDDRALALMASLGVGALVDRFFSTLSSGEKKRVGIARALMPNPEVLILDEPTSGLDLGGRESLLATLSSLAYEPLAPVMVLVTHHVEEIPQGFTHALLLKEGRAFASGLIDDVMTSDNLSALFGESLEVRKESGRFYARMN